LMEASARLALQGAVCLCQTSNPKSPCFCNNSPRWPTYQVVVPLHLRVVPSPLFLSYLNECRNAYMGCLVEQQERTGDC
jgi:hypothetical protein